MKWLEKSVSSASEEHSDCSVFNEEPLTCVSFSFVSGNKQAKIIKKTFIKQV